MLHAALRQILGSRTAKGSLVASDVLRFDFANDQPVTFEQLQEIERLVNAEVIANTPVTTELLDIESAKAKGAMMLFGEKYGEEVRVLSMGSVIDEKTSQSNCVVVFTLNVLVTLVCLKSRLKVV